MKRQTTHPSKRSRQERALEQRRKDLAYWKLDPASIMARTGSFRDKPEIGVDEKIAKCEAEIATLERKLGVKHDA